MVSLPSIRTQLLASSHTFVQAVFDLAGRLVPADAQRGTTGSKDFNDPIWKVIALDGAELDICELPLMQRMRRVRQLGLGYLVFPSVQHSRFEHSLGAVYAATRMFDQLARGAKNARETELEGLFRTVRLAALMHDCGHPVFSHVGERVLGHLYAAEFRAIAAQLNALFPDPLMDSLQIGQQTSPKEPAAAEVMAALFLLSEPMERLLSDCVPITGVPWPQAIINTVALILGKPRGLVVEGRYHHWVRGIVSGDLDSDKLDYVARDAYFAGMPVSADVMRLLSQLASVVYPKNKLQPEAKADGKKLVDLDQTRVLALRPSGVSAFEMFVMTRSYLFDRLYGHHKTRSAERLMQRVLNYHLRVAISDFGWKATDVLQFLYMMGGDDAALAKMAKPEAGDPADSEVQKLASAVLARDLPRRAIQISQRFCVEGFQRQMGQVAAVAPWTFLQAFLNDDAKRSDLTQLIGQITGLNHGLEFILDPPLGVPIKEDPDVWVLATGSEEAPRGVNKYFDAEQLSNAYRDVKRVAWVFTAKEHAVRVAAGTAAALQKMFDLSIHQDAIEAAKLSLSDYQAQLRQLREVGHINQQELENLIGDPGSRVMLPTDTQMAATLVAIEGEGHFRNAQQKLRDGLTRARINRVYTHDYLLVLTVLRVLVKHAAEVWRAKEFKDHVPNGNEARFQKSVAAHLKREFTATGGFDVTEHGTEAAGYTDIVITHRSETTRVQSVVVELKAAQDKYDQLVKDHAGQSQQYAELRPGPISILYAQFKEDSAITLADTLDVRVATTTGSSSCTVCLGTRAFAETASAGGRTALGSSGGPAAVP